MSGYLETPTGRRIAFHRSNGRGPGVVFLGGFKSDMTGTKALWLDNWARERGRAFLRFDYSGHGDSSGTFEEGCIDDWFAGLVTIAAAPDFTEQGFWSGFTDAQRRTLMTAGRIELPSEYAGQPYVITRRLIEDGRDHLVMTQRLPLPFPVRMLQGTADADVPVDWAMRLLDHADGQDMRLTLVKGADHRFSSSPCLSLIGQSIDDVLA